MKHRWKSIGKWWWTYSYGSRRIEMVQCEKCGAICKKSRARKGIGPCEGRINEHEGADNG